MLSNTRFKRIIVVILDILERMRGYPKG